MKKQTFLTASAWAFASSLVTNTWASTSTVEGLEQNNYVNWITKSVCVNNNDAVLAVDPYDGCPAGSSLRKIKLGDPLPYANFDQYHAIYGATLSQRADSIPLYDKDGNTAYINTFDFYPHGQFNLFDGSDGYNVIAVKNNWVSWANTKDGGGYGQTFFGTGCNLGDGWRLFPINNFLNTQEVTAQSLIQGVYWEQTGQSFPGACPSANSYVPVNTAYQLNPAFEFGWKKVEAGQEIQSTKTMAAVVSTHGYPYNIERVFFTREYGLTRWRKISS